MAKDNKKVFFKTNLDLVILLSVTVIFALLEGFGALQKIDYRLYDIMLGTKKEAKSSDSILFVDIDDDSINALGQWPWSRDILGDALIRMKELGASKAVFDIEYLSPAKLGVNPKAVDIVAEAFSNGEAEISGVINELSTAIAQGQISKGEVSEVSSQMITDYVDPSLQTLYTSVTDNMFRDNDTYFARAVQFFGNTWLTIGARDVGIPVSKEDTDYVHKRFMFKNIDDKNGLIEKSNQYSAEEAANAIRGFSPAIHSIISFAQGAGFTNVVVDKDGTRRRIELLANYNGEYVGQLVFAPLLDIIQPDSIERKGKKLIIKNALFPGEKERTNVTIPLDSHGRMLINWLHKDFGDSFKHNPVKDLFLLNDIESKIVYNLSYFSDQLTVRDNEGYDLPYLADAVSLKDEYNELNAYKESLLGMCKGYDETGAAVDGGISQSDYDDYFAARAAYFTHVQSFLDAGYDNSILSRLDELSSEVENVAEAEQTVKDVFAALKQDLSDYNSNFNEMKNAYNGKFCIVGNTSTATTDLGVTPFKRSYANVGTHANVLNTIIQRDFITPINWLWGIVLAFASALLIILITRNMSSGKQNSLGIIYVFLPTGLIIALMAFFGIYVPILAPALIAITSYVGETLFHFVTAEKDKSFLRRAFSTYLSKDVVNVIVKDPSKLTLGGEDKHMTALFSDVRSFSSFSEMVTPTKLVSVLNVYLGQLSDAIMDNQGTIDKYIGDEIVSFFGAPLDNPDHAYCACAAGIRMKQLEAAYNKEHLASGDIPRELESRVGINTGNMVVGNMGTDLKMNYTIMGNDVNLASRLEGVNKVYHSWILASEQTWTEADGGAHKGEILARRFDKVRVIGINKPVQLYNILGFKKELPEDQKQSVDIFHEGLDLYLNKEFQKAGKKFVEANKCFPSDESPLVFASRCKDYLETGVPGDWDGVVNMTSK